MVFILESWQSILKLISLSYTNWHRRVKSLPPNPETSGGLEKKIDKWLDKAGKSRKMTG